MEASELQALIGRTRATQYRNGPWERVAVIAVRERHCGDRDCAVVRFTRDKTTAIVDPDLLVSPDELPQQAMIRYAEAMIRAEHRILDEDWTFWGNLADHLNHIALTPDKTGQRHSDWRDYNRAQVIALGYIWMSAAAEPCQLCGGGGKIVRMYPDSDPEPWRPGSYADGVVQDCPAPRHLEGREGDGIAGSPHQRDE